MNRQTQSHCFTSSRGPTDRSCFKAFLFVAAALFATASDAEEPRTLTGRLDTVLKEHGLPAIGARIVQRGETVDEVVVGVRKLGEASAVTAEDLWHIGSITKSFTSTLVATFVEQGDLQWDSTLGEILGLTAAGHYSNVTLAHLLSHRSGLPANVDFKRTRELMQEGASVPQQRATLLHELLQTIPAAEAGQHFEYSNAGYIVTGALLEARFGLPWETLLRQRVLEPLHLASAGFGAPGTPGLLDQPRGHLGNQGQLRAIEPGLWADNAPFLGPAGTLHMSLGDLSRWVQEHLRGENGHGTLLQAPTYQRLHQADDGEYAFGWVDQRAPTRVVWHNGSNTMWYAVVAFDPANDIAITVVCNGGIGAAPVVDALLRDLFADVRQSVRQSTEKPERNDGQSQ